MKFNGRLNRRVWDICATRKSVSTLSKSGSANWVALSRSGFAARNQDPYPERLKTSYLFEGCLRCAQGCSAMQKVFGLRPRLCRSWLCALCSWL